MTIETWNLLFSAGITALLLIGGIWLKQVVDQQLKAKDSAIQALDSAIKSKDAEISALKADTAPAITKAYAEMRQHANQMTEEAQRLSQKVKSFTAEQVTSLIVEQRHPEYNHMFIAAINEAKGLQLGSDIVLKGLQRRVFSGEKPPERLSVLDVADDFLDCFAEINRQTSNRLNTAEELKNL